MIRDIYIDNALRERWDDDARTVTTFDRDGKEAGRRSYSEVEVAEAQERSATEAERKNQASIEEALSGALTDLQAIIDSTNATINQNPASAIKTLARAQRRVIRLLLRRFDSSS